MNAQTSTAADSSPVKTAADIYDELFLDVLCLPWAEHLTDVAGFAPGDDVLDVACGTGAVAGVAWRKLGGDGTVQGLDRRADMLAVARRKMPQHDWWEGRAEALPFEDGSFDKVFCQFGLMFFDDREQALREMHRVLKPGGRVVIAVWDGLDRTPAYAALTGLIDQHLGADAAAATRDSFALGDPAMVAGLLEGAGFAAVSAGSVAGLACFGSLATWVDAEVKGWVGGGFSDEDYERFFAEAERVLAAYVRPDGKAEFVLPAVVASGARG